MNAYLNYLIEANIGLLLLIACYKLLLHRETNFKLSRIFLLAGIFASMLFPLIHIGNGPGSTSPFSIGNVIPSYWLPEVVIGGEATKEIHEGSFTFWKYTALIYTTGLILSGLMVLYQLSQLFRMLQKANTYRLQKLRIAESTEDKSTFSFFHFIFIGKADQLSSSEKEQIIQHESVHARQWHSFDILLINLLKVIFWFNPLISTYKKIFIQLHEFEADARAVENTDVNRYCSLLARVALQSADFRMANHFNNSLTVKRIEMMRTIKTNIKQWKLVTLGTMLPLLFFFIACQDQVADELTEITKNSSHALMVPAYIQEKFEKLKKENPDKKYALLELNETASNKLESLKKQYGLPKSIEVFKTVEGKPAGNMMRNEAGNTIINEKIVDPALASGDDMNLRQTKPAVEGEQTFAIVEFNEETSKIAEASREGQVFSVVEEQPEYPGGYDSMLYFIRHNLRYPLEARQQGIEGTVYVAFIVESDGTITSVNTIQGLSPECDNEVKRVVEMFPNWIPGKQSGQNVRVRFVLPVKFKFNM